MRATTAILHMAGKEIRAFFVSPIAYVVLTGFVVLSGWFFFNLLVQFNRMIGMYEMMRSRVSARSQQQVEMVGYQRPSVAGSLSLFKDIAQPR